MKITFNKTVEDAGFGIGLMYHDSGLADGTQALDRKCDGYIGTIIDQGRFNGAEGQILRLTLPVGSPFRHMAVLGCGNKSDRADQVAARKMGATIVTLANELGVSMAQVLSHSSGQDWRLAVAEGVVSASYRFDQYRTCLEDKDKPTLNAVVITSPDPTSDESAWRDTSSVMEGMFLARSLILEPSNILYPETFAARIKDLESYGIEVDILSPGDMEKLGMGALLNVGRGSVRSPRLAVMQWNGGSNSQPLAFIGKGVTFDTGGISIKPSAGMEEMKADMSGAAAVTGLMRALAGRKAKVNAVGLVGLVENMPSGSAQNPGDIVTSMSGQTIEVLNTDAEGRLVLADVLTYAQERFNPALMIDLATLTGAIVVSLGEEYAGLFANEDDLAGELVAAGEASGERLWRFPLAKVYDKMLDSKVADMQNITGRRGAGSITAAQFLQRFVDDKTPWAHLDIAGVAFRKEARGEVPGGASGFGVRLLNNFIGQYFRRAENTKA